LLVLGPLFGFAYGGAIVMMPTLIANYFGASSFAAINGFMFPVQIGFAAVVPVGAGYLADTTGTYDLAFIILAVFIAGAVVCALMASPPVPSEDGEEQAATNE
ncbi:MAG: hypothetical protein KUG81_06100, partial [Gammaproteobacteria bacterium]|nr:hypothetical protein [Gammaproteobacteria bacterium]